MKIKDEDGFEIDEDFSEKSSKETKKDNFNNSKSNNNNTSCYDEEDLNSHKKRLPNKFKYKIVILLGISVLLSIFIISFLSYNTTLQ